MMSDVALAEPGSGRHCSICAGPLGRYNRSGLCRPHFVARMNADPLVSERRLAAVRVAAARDIYAKRRTMAANHRRALARPEHRKWLRERMRTMVQPLSQTPEALAKVDRARRGRATSATRLAWCPPEHRDEYRRLVRSKRLPAAEARAVILAAIAAERGRMTPFERTMADLEAQTRRALAERRAA